MPGAQGTLVDYNKLEPADKLGTPGSHNCRRLARGVFPHVPQQGVFLSAQNVGNVITGEMTPC